MANYYATARSNYFRVKDAAAFEAWCTKRSLRFWKDNADERYAVSPENADQGWPTFDEENESEFGIFDELVPHLHPKDVAVFIEIGSEALRYLVGEAHAVHANGVIDRVSLDDIYDRAMESAEDGATVTEAVH